MIELAGGRMRVLSEGGVAGFKVEGDGFRG